MASIAPVIHNMNAATLKVGTDNYEKSVSSAKLTPTTPIGKWKGIDGSTTKTAGVPDWLLTLNLAQDWVTAASLAKYLSTNAGTTKAIELTPQTGGTKFAVTVLCVPTEVGGDVDATSVATIALEVIGQPVLT